MMAFPAVSFAPCRGDDLFEPIEEFAAPIQRSIFDEAYYFCWRSECSRGFAKIRIARQARRVAVSRLFRPSDYRKPRRSRAWLNHADWERLEDALVEAQFWLLDRYGSREGHVLDGARWLIQGWRAHDYHSISRHSPSGPLHDLGRCFFDFAGLEDVRL
jgi:hypothetical protein